MAGWHVGDAITPPQRNQPAHVVIVFASGNIVVRYDADHAHQWLDKHGLPMPPECRR